MTASRYRIFTDATADLSPSLLEGLSSVRVIPMEVSVGGAIHTCGPEGDLDAAGFYRLQRAGQFATTSQINPEAYRARFEPVLRDGEDILYLCFSSGLSSTWQSVQICIEELRAAWPERKIIAVDTLGASIGEGLLVREAMLRRAAGVDLAALADWVLENRLRAAHWFAVDTFEHLRQGGRVSAATAAVGSVLQVKPVLTVDREGRLQAVEKPLGMRRAAKSLLARMEESWTPEFSRTVVVGHADNAEGAALLREQVARRFPEADVRTGEIGPVIGAHTGPGMLALAFWSGPR